jgi:hypothetical protein
MSLILPAQSNMRLVYNVLNLRFEMGGETIEAFGTSITKHY